MALATNLGIWFMLAVVAAMLAAFASFFLYLMRRAKLAAGQSDSAETGRLVGGQEGTAQC
jgi:maltodextrin utilization protein YvdJ